MYRPSTTRPSYARSTGTVDAHDVTNRSAAQPSRAARRRTRTLTRDPPHSSLARVATLDDVARTDLFDHLGGAARRMPLGLAEPLRHLDDAPLDAPEDAGRGEPAHFVALARGPSGEDLDPIGRLVHGVDVELLAAHGFDHVVAEHEMRQVGAR